MSVCGKGAAGSAELEFGGPVTATCEKRRCSVVSKLTVSVSKIERERGHGRKSETPVNKGLFTQDHAEASKLPGEQAPLLRNVFLFSNAGM